MKIENITKAIAGDGKTFEGDKAVEMCCKYEIDKLKKELAEVKFEALNPIRIEAPLLSFYTDNPYVYYVKLNDKKDFETVKDWWNLNFEYSCDDCLSEPKNYPFCGFICIQDCYMDIREANREALQAYKLYDIVQKG